MFADTSTTMERKYGGQGVQQQQQQPRQQQSAPSKAQLAREFARNSTLTQKEEELLAQLQRVEEEDADCETESAEEGSETTSSVGEDDSTLAEFLPEKPIETVGEFCRWFTELTEKTADPSVPTQSRLPPWTALLESMCGEEQSFGEKNSDAEDDGLSCFMTESLEQQQEEEKGEQELAQESESGVGDAEELCRDLEGLRAARARVEGWRRDVDAVAAQGAAVLAGVRTVHAEAARLTAARDRAERLASALEQRLWHFDQLHMLSRRLAAGSARAGTPVAPGTLAELDACLAFFAQHRAYRDAPAALAQLARLQAAALATVRDHVVALLRGCTTTVQQQHALRRKVLQGRSSASVVLSTSTSASTSADGGDSENVITNVESLDTDPMYLQFRVLAPQVRPHVRELEARAAGRGLLGECHSAYFHERVVLLNPPLTQYLQARTGGNLAGGVAAVARDCCGFIARVCRLEGALYAAFFATPSALAAKLVEAAAASLRETLRPLLLRERSTDALCLTCSILRQCIEDVSEGSSQSSQSSTPDTTTSSSSSSTALSDVLAGLVREAQERLTFLAQRTIQEDIAAFVPTDADLDYPAKLAPSMMEGSANGNSKQDSSNQEEEEEEIGNVMAAVERVYACWYPTVQRTLTLLSKLYLTVDARVFEGLAQEAVDACLDTLNGAAAALAQRRGALDGQLFLVRHLLTLREQLAPFEVALARETVALDFGRVRAELRRALGGGFSALFSLDAAALAPRVHTARADARQRLDAALTAAVEGCIVAQTKGLLRPLLSLLVQVASFDAVHASSAAGAPAGASESPSAASPPPAQLASQPWAAPSAFTAAAQHVRAAVRTDVPPLVARVLAYLPPAAAAALLRPVRDNVLDSWDRFTAVLRRTHPGAAETVLAEEPLLPALLDAAFQPLEDALSGGGGPDSAPAVKTAGCDDDKDSNAAAAPSPSSEEASPEEATSTEK